MSDTYTRRRMLIASGAISSIAVAGCMDDEDDEPTDDEMDDEEADDEVMSDNGMEDDDEDEMADDEMNGEEGDDDEMEDGDEAMDDEDEMADEGEEDDGMDNDDETNDEASFADHPLGQDSDDWPHLGPDPSDAPATLVVLDDPSCPRCAAFHEDTITELETNYVESDELAIVNRPYPVVYEWGEPAAHALEATNDRDEAAYWDLLNYYFTDQESFDVETVLEETETWLADNTDLDADAIVTDAREETFSERIDATLSAAEDADAGEVTPSTFAFRDGELQTSLNGSVSPVTIETVLGL